MFGTLRHHSRSSRSTRVSFSTVALRRKPLPQANAARREWTRNEVRQETKSQSRAGPVVPISE